MNNGNREFNNFLLLKFFGKIIHAGVNFPRSQNERKLAAIFSYIYLNLEDYVTQPGYYVLWIRTFVTSKRLGGGNLVRVLNGAKPLKFCNNSISPQLILYKNYSFQVKGKFGI